MATRLEANLVSESPAPTLASTVLNTYRVVFEHLNCNLRTAMWKGLPYSSTYAITRSGNRRRNVFISWDEKAARPSSRGGAVVEMRAGRWLGIYEGLNDEVRSFLANNPSLEDVLKRAVAPVRHYFGDVSATLTYHQLETWGQLFVTISVSDPIDTALDRLDQFDHDWFCNEDAKVRELITFDVTTASV